MFGTKFGNNVTRGPELATAVLKQPTLDAAHGVEVFEVGTHLAHFVLKSRQAIFDGCCAHKSISTEEHDTRK